MVIPFSRLLLCVSYSNNASSGGAAKPAWTSLLARRTRYMKQIKNRTTGSAASPLESFQYESEMTFLDDMCMGESR